ncbi:MAG: acetolactate synthase large subunit [Gammaproteobacteria bacterium]|jgi:acetolactate synthase-1/2/3 large subunit|nr:acetolactate synthase large subunit [Gammaproteobacteria bacterium]
MKAAELFVRCLENEGVEYIFGIPGEENLALMDALQDSSIRFVTVRHEQGAGFMADVYGRLTGRAGVCLSTLGPGATNLITAVADANMDYAPLVAIAGQAGTNRLHKESHQVLDLESIFQHITKYSSRLLTPRIIPEVVRKAFKLAQMERTGAAFIEFPENIAAMDVDDEPLRVSHPLAPEPAAESVLRAAEIISNAQRPMILAGNGVIRAGACAQLQDFADRLNIPVANTFMAKGIIPFGHPLALGTAGLQSRDYVNVGFDHADVIICIGYDLVEYHPHLWHPTRDRKIIHIASAAAEVDASYEVAAGVVGDIRHALTRVAAAATPHPGHLLRPLREALIEDMNRHGRDDCCPLKPQKIIWDLRTALGLEDIVICDVGAHKMWMARMFRCEHPNTCLISNGFASMGIAVPGAIAAKLARPERAVVAVTGDAGFLMNSQEIETAMRLGLAFVILVWNDNGYGLIEWKQMQGYGRSSNVRFTNPDFIKYAEAFGAKGYRIERAEDLLPVLRRALADNTVSIIDCPVDYSENLKLTAKLGEMVAPI